MKGRHCLPFPFIYKYDIVNLLFKYATSPAPEEHEVIELKVDRPFYAISLKDDFPLFVNKVNDPSK